MIQGSIVAIVTPMHADGSLDLPGLRNLIDWHIAEGTDGIVIVGTTGESPTLSHDEHKRVVELCIKVSAGRVPVLHGVLLAPVLLVLAFMLASSVGVGFSAWLACYFLLTCAYSWGLKRLVLVDCLVLAMLYTLRIIAGAAASALPATVIEGGITHGVLAMDAFVFGWSGEITADAA